MKLITKQQLIESAADRYYQQYSQYKLETWIDHHARITAATTEDEIADIIGNRAWTHIPCDECDTDVDIAVQLGNEPDYDSHTATLCIPCIEKALLLARETGPSQDSG